MTFQSLRIATMFSLLKFSQHKLKIYLVDKITENVIRKYIEDLQTRGIIITGDYDTLSQYH